MKKYCLLFLAAALSFGIMASTGYAQAAYPSIPVPENDNPYMTFASPDTTPQTTFGWNETPFVYLELSGINPGRTLNLQNIWKYGGSVEDTQTFTSTGSSLTDWRGLSNWLGTGLGSRKAGDWTVETTWGYNGSKYTTTAKNAFSVTPEPVSLVLFGLGAGVLGLSRLRRKKK